MSWLHCFWGVGATAGPYIMGFVLMRGMSWNTGYRTISIMQMVLTAVLIFTLSLWREKSDRAETEEEKQKTLSLPDSSLQFDSARKSFLFSSKSLRFF